MSVNYQIDHDNSRVTVNVSGAYTANDIKAYLNGVWSDPIADGISGYDELFIFEEAEFQGTVQDNIELARYGNKFDSEGSRGKIALVNVGNRSFVPSTEVYKGVRNRMQNAIRRVENFDNTEAALNWLQDSA